MDVLSIGGTAGKFVRKILKKKGKFWEKYYRSRRPLEVLENCHMM